MTIKETIKERHTVRKYKNIPISSNLIELLNKRIAKNNEVYGLNMVLVTENSDGINGIAKLVLAKGVNNYIVLAGTDSPALKEKQSRKQRKKRVDH